MDSYLRDRGVFDNPDAAENIVVVGDADGNARWNAGDLESLEEYLIEYKPKVVIIDSIRKAIADPLGISENEAIIGMHMDRVQQAAARHGAIVIWLHHNNKDKAAQGLNKISGSTAITQTPSEVWLMSKVGTDTETDFTRNIYNEKIRKAAKFSINYKMMPDITCVNIGKGATPPTEEQKTVSAKDRVRRLLLESETGLGREELEQALPDVNKDNIRQACNRLVKDSKSGIKARKSTKDNKTDIYYATAQVKQREVELATLSQAQQRAKAEIANRYANAEGNEEEEEEFDFESSPFNPDNGFNPADLELATPKGADAEPEQAVAGDRTVIEAEAIEVEEAVVEPSVEEPTRYSADHEVAIADVSEREQAVVCDRDGFVTVDGIEYEVGSTVVYTDLDLNLEAKVLGKGWIPLNDEEGLEGVTVQFPEGKRESLEFCESVREYEEWVVAPGEVRTVFTDSLVLPGQTKAKKSPRAIEVDGKAYRIGEILYSFTSSDYKERSKVRVVGKDWVIEGIYGGVTIEFMEGYPDSIPHINGNEWIVAPGKVKTYPTTLLTRDDINTFTFKGETYRIGEVVIYHLQGRDLKAVVTGAEKAGDVIEGVGVRLIEWEKGVEENFNGGKNWICRCNSRLSRLEN